MEAFVALDVETTGLDAGRDSIIEIAAVKFKGSRIENQWESLINPNRHIPEFITTLTGIDDAMVRQAPRLPGIKEVAQQDRDGGARRRAPERIGEEQNEHHESGELAIVPPIEGAIHVPAVDVPEVVGRLPYSGRSKFRLVTLGVFSREVDIEQCTPCQSAGRA